MHNLRISRHNATVTPQPPPPAPLTTTTNPQIATPQNTSVAGETASTSPGNGSIAKSVKLRPRQSIKRAHDFIPTIASLRATGRNHNYTETEANDSILSVSSTSSSAAIVADNRKLNLRRRKINVNDHHNNKDDDESPDSTLNMDSSSSNVSCLSDTSTTAPPVTATASNRMLRRK